MRANADPSLPALRGERFSSAVAPPRGDNAPAISAENLVKRYRRKTALDGLTFHIPRGRVCGFLGRSSYFDPAAY
jgi:hypothetical protein